jgi:hypothetical protein
VGKSFSLVFRFFPRCDEMTSPWTPYRETLGATLARTGAIAVILGGVLAARSGGGLARWPVATVLTLWPALGGHFVELAFLNGLRPRLPISRPVQVAARLAVWFAAGIALTAAMCLTATALNTLRAALCPRWWIGGLAFIGLELLVHLVLHLRGTPSFYDGRG